MKLILFRHAERDHHFGGGNPPLSHRGAKQAETLPLLVNKEILPAPQKLLASPRLRTQMTFAPLAKEHNLEIQIHSELEEKLRLEKLFDFISRVEKFLEICVHKQGTIYICTHVDWIHEAMRGIPLSQEPDLMTLSWNPGEYAFFTVEGKTWHLEGTGGLHP